MKTMTHEKNMIDYQDFLQKKNPEATVHVKADSFDKANVHAHFLNSQPKLGDFIPTNEKGEVMGRLPSRLPKHKDRPPDKTTEDYREEYKKALDRRLWKGWEVREETGYCVLIEKLNGEPGGQIAECYTSAKEWNWYEIKTYEQLITSGVKLERIEKK